MNNFDYSSLAFIPITVHSSEALNTHIAIASSMYNAPFASQLNTCKSSIWNLINRQVFSAYTINMDFSFFLSLSLPSLPSRVVIFDDARENEMERRRTNIAECLLINSAILRRGFLLFLRIS